MYPIIHYLKGSIRNLFNSRISFFSIVSSNAKVHKTAYIYRGVKVKRSDIGAHTYISNNTDVENAVIGKYCSIADHCRIGMGTHSLQCLSTSPIFTQVRNGLQERWVDKNVFEYNRERECAVLGNDVWVGSHVLINGGVRVGNGACIAAGAVVVKDVPPYAIVGGVPAKIIRYRFPSDVICLLDKLKWWNLPDDVLKNNLKIFQKEDISSKELNAFLCEIEKNAK